MAERIKELPLNIVGSSVFGRYPKISVEKTYNMIISDGWLVSYPGFALRQSIAQNATGRGVFSSKRMNGFLFVIDNIVYSARVQHSALNNNRIVSYRKIGEIGTQSGNVFMDENEKQEIAICDQQNIYIYNYANSTFTPCELDFIPGSVTYHNGYFIAASLGLPQWRLNDLVTTTSFPSGNARYTGGFQTKGDTVLNVIRMPGNSDFVLVQGSNVSEIWAFQAGAQLFPYIKNTYSNVDYGVASSATVASLEKMIAWFGGNENSGYSVMCCAEGGGVQRVSSDGIDYLFESLRAPQDSYAFMMRIGGHNLYQLTFYTDNLTLVFDFTTKKIFHACDKNFNYHLAKKACSFDNSYFFISSRNGNVYEMNDLFTDYAGEEIQRIRIPQTIRDSDGELFRVKSLNFTIEQGVNPGLSYLGQQRIDLSISINGGQSFSNWMDVPMNSLGNYQNRINITQLGSGNEWTPQLRFQGFNRFAVSDGVVRISQ